jgi:hypothetical protein
MPIVVKFNKKDYKAEVTPSDTVESIRNLLKLSRVEFYYCGSQLALKDTMEIARITSGSILKVKLPRLRESRSVPLAQWRLTTEHTSRSHTLQRIAGGVAVVDGKLDTVGADVESMKGSFSNQRMRKNASAKRALLTLTSWRESARKLAAIVARKLRLSSRTSVHCSMV